MFLNNHKSEAYRTRMLKEIQDEISEISSFLNGNESRPWIEEAYALKERLANMPVKRITYQYKKRIIKEIDKEISKIKSSANPDCKIFAAEARLIRKRILALNIS